MKVRHGYVTNSSSSSYIISSNSPFQTVDEVYGFIRKAYMEIPSKIAEAFQIIFDAGYMEPGGRYFDKCRQSEHRREMEDILEEYSFDTYSLDRMASFEIPEWCRCETYAEYCDFVKTHGQEEKLFEIVDLRVFPKSSDDVAIIEEILDWYNYEKYQIIEDSEEEQVQEDCESCEFKRECKKSNPSACRLSNYDRDELSEYVIYRELKLATLLGTIAVYTEDGVSIEECVIKQLEDISCNCCGHMG